MAHNSDGEVCKDLTIRSGDEVSYAPLTYGQLPEDPGSQFLMCRFCEPGRFSAARGDYFWRRPDSQVTCLLCDEPMVLAREVKTIEIVTPIACQHRIIRTHGGGDEDGIPATSCADCGEAAPYPWCQGNPKIGDCIRAGFCRRSPSCGD